MPLNIYDIFITCMPRDVKNFLLRARWARVLSKPTVEFYVLGFTFKE